jgi:phosphoglycerol transferase MdoB-like AlkP superfamily enzyme
MIQPSDTPSRFWRTSAWRTRAERIALPLLLAVAFIIGTGLLDGGIGIMPVALWDDPAWLPWWNAPLRMASNALPGLLLALLLLALTRRALLSFFVAFLAQALVYGVNALKVANLGTPLMPADFRMVGQLGDGGGDLLSGYLPHSPWPYLAIVGGIAVLVLLARYEPPVLAPRRWRVRTAFGMVAAFALATLLAGQPSWAHVYDRGRLGMQPWSATATARHAGLVSSLMLFRLQYGAEHKKPDANAAIQLMAKYDRDIRSRLQAPQPDAEQRPDIVVILSESFFDPTILNGYGRNVDFMPNLRRLAAHGTSGRLHVPTFGGGTIRTEFEVLTGLSLRYFDDIQFPYLQIHTKVIPGIVRTLEAHGYQTLAVHGNDPGFWNRTSAFKALGFDEFISIKQFPPDDDANDGKYMSDKAFTDELLRQLKPDGPPRFVLGISIEAHGPYDQAHGIDIKERDAIPVPAKVTGQAKVELQNYIYHIRHADHELGRLADTLAKRDRPTLIVFFGDHLPAIVPAFQQAGFKDGKGFLVQTPPYVLIDTARPAAPPVRLDAAAWMLPGMLLDRAGIHDDAYFALTRVVAPELANLTRAPDAPPPAEDTAQKQLDAGMANIAMLRLAGKLDDLWPKAAAAAAEQQPSSGTDAPPDVQPDGTLAAHALHP